MITLDQFKTMELRVGRILSAAAHPNADRLYLLDVDLGTERRTLVAGIRPFYTPEQLVGTPVVVVANLAPATIRGVVSNGMVLAAQDGDRVSLVTVDQALAPGSPVA